MTLSGVQDAARFWIPPGFVQFARRVLLSISEGENSAVSGKQNNTG